MLVQHGDLPVELLGRRRTLTASPSRAAIRSVRFSPPPPTIDRDAGPPGAGRTSSRAGRPARRRTPWCRRPTAPASSRWPTRECRAAPGPAGNGDAVTGVLALPPAGTDPDEGAAAAEHVERRGGLGDDARRPEGHRGHQRAQPSPVPSPASMPRVTQGSGMGSQTRPTWGIWITWSISATPANPASSAASATDRQPRRRVLAPREPGHLEHDLQPLRAAPVGRRSGRVPRGRHRRRPQAHDPAPASPGGRRPSPRRRARRRRSASA